MSTPLDNLVDYADHLPSLPAAVTELLSLLSREETQTAELVEAFAQDPALVSRLLKLANSAYYGISRRVGTIQQALLVLGRKTTHALVVAAAAEDVLREPCEGYLFPAGGLWRHSLAVGHASRLLAVRTGRADRDEAFVAGLLHDVGKVVLSEYLLDYADELYDRLSGPDEVAFIAIENELLAVDYATVGAAIAERWQLPPRLRQAILHHPRPSLAGDEWELPAVVHVANAVTLSLGIGLGLDGMMYELDTVAVDRLRVDDPSLVSVATELYAALNEAAAG